MNTAGTIIKKERLKRGISYEHISSITKISVDTLKCIEEGDMTSMPSTYVKGFLRAISKVLELDADEIIKTQFETSFEDDENEAGEVKVPVEPKVEPKKLRVVEKPEEPKLEAATDSSKSITSVFDKKQTLASIKGKNGFSFNKISITPKQIIAVAVPAVIIALGFVIYNNNGFIDELFVELNSTTESASTTEETVDPVKLEKVEDAKIAKEDIFDKKEGELAKTVVVPPVKPVTRSNGFSVLTIFASGRSWVKLQIDNQNVQTMTFIAGMTRSFKIYDLAKVFIGDVSQVDVYYENKKMRFAGGKEKIIKLKHTLVAKKAPVKSIKMKKRASKVDRELISKPKLSPELLTR